MYSNDEIFRVYLTLKGIPGVYWDPGGMHYYFLKKGSEHDLFSEQMTPETSIKVK